MVSMRAVFLGAERAFVPGRREPHGAASVEGRVWTAGKFGAAPEIRFAWIGRIDERGGTVTTGTITDRPPLPPFDADSASAKARLAEDAWNSRDPQRVAGAYTTDSRWRNRSEFFAGRAEIVAFLERKWARELDYKLIKEVWAFAPDRIAVRFAYEWHDAGGQWFRSHGNELWEFDAHGLMRRREASINDVAIADADRRFRWDGDRRPDGHPGLTALGL
jgi:nuclear transport factor 2 (NTF2) superfamily protein